MRAHVYPTMVGASSPKTWYGEGLGFRASNITTPNENMSLQMKNFFTIDPSNKDKNMNISLNFLTH